jgi:membrane-associated phospholipid phosphatase
MNTLNFGTIADLTRLHHDHRTMHDVEVLSRLGRLSWALAAISAAVVIAASGASEFSIQWRTFAMPVLTCSLLLVTGWYYCYRRADPRLASALTCTAELAAFTAVAAPLSYFAAAANLPLQDHFLDATDHMLGLDWKGLLAWMSSHPQLHPIFRQAYLSLMPQMVIVVLALAYTGRLRWLRVFTLSFFFAALATISVSALLPAEGAWGFYGLTPYNHAAIIPATRDIHLPIFHGLRNGSFRLLMASGSEGIITFPSLHAALAIILAAGLWPVPVLRWVGLVLNVVVLVSVPVDGGHYFTDAFAGLGIGAISLAAASALADIAARWSHPTVALAKIGLAAAE